MHSKDEIKDKRYMCCPHCKNYSYHNKLNIFEDRLQTFRSQSFCSSTFEDPLFHSHICLNCGTKVKIDIFEF